MSEESRKALIEGFKLTGYPSICREPLKLQCPLSVRHSSDQLRCTLCNMVWDTDELKPTCPYEVRP